MTSRALLLFLVAPAACAGVYSDPDADDPQAGEVRDPDPGNSGTPDPGPGGKPTTGDKRVFVTSMTYQGGLLGGLAGADTKCNARAEVAGLAGNYKAWLSTRLTTAASRLTHSTGAYRLIDGTTVAANWDELVSGTLQNPIDHDELGHLYSAPSNCGIVGGVLPVWTATTYEGVYEQAFDETCVNWTEIEVGGFYGDGGVGNAQAADTFWTESLCAIACVDHASLYCLEQ